MTQIIRPIFISPRTPAGMLRRLHDILGWRVREPHNDNAVIGGAA